MDKGAKFGSGKVGSLRRRVEEVIRRTKTVRTADRYKVCHDHLLDFSRQLLEMITTGCLSCFWARDHRVPVCATAPSCFGHVPVGFAKDMLVSLRIFRENRRLATNRHCLLPEMSFIVRPRPVVVVKLVPVPQPTATNLASDPVTGCIFLVQKIWGARKWATVARRRRMPLGWHVGYVPKWRATCYRFRRIWAHGTVVSGKRW